MTGDHLQDFEDHLRQAGRADRTVRGYLRDLRLFARWIEQTTGEPLSPARLTPTDVRLYRQHLLAVEKAAPATVNRRLAAIRAYARWARETGRTEINAANGVRGVAEQQTAPRWLSRTEQAALLREAERDLAAARTEAARRQALRDRAILVLLLHTGLRVGELCALELSDLEISERKGSLRVRAGKGEKARTVPLNRTARAALREWLEVRPEAETPLLFVGKRGDGLTPSAVQRRLAALGRRAGVEATPHTLRHTFAKNLVDAGVTLEKVAALLGHASLNTTRIYTTPSQADLDRAVRALEG